MTVRPPAGSFLAKGRPGSRLPGLVVVVALVSLIPLWALVLGADLGRLGELAGGPETGLLGWAVAHTAVEGLAALAALTLAAAALSGFLVSRDLALALPATVFGVVALLDGLHASVGWLPSVLPAGREDAAAFTWLLSRLFLAAALTLGTWHLNFRRRSPRAPAVLVATGVAGIVALGLAAASFFAPRLPALVDPGALVPRPFELVPLVLFAAAGLAVFPAAHRASPSTYSQAAIASAIPQAICQLLAALGDPYSGLLLLAHLEKLFAYLVLLGGLIFAFGETRRSRRNALEDLRLTRRQLDEQTARLEQIGRELTEAEGEREQAQRSVRLLERAVETTKLGVTISDLEGRIVYVNPADARLHGYQVKELLGQPARIYAAGRGRRPVAEPVNWQDPVWEREVRNRRKDGSVFPARLLSSVVQDPEGRPLGVVTLCEDITERLEVRAALERRDRILEAVALAAERFLAEGAIEEGVGEVLERLGQAAGADRVYIRSVEEGNGDSLLREHTWVSPYSRLKEPRWGSGKISFREGRFPHWRTRLAAGHTLQDRVEDLPQEERAMLLARGVRAVVVVPIFAESTWWGFLCLEDATAGRVWPAVEVEALRTAARTLGAAIQRRQAVGALAASQESYRDLLENAHDLIQSVSPEGRFYYVNRAWLSTLGYSDAEVARLTIRDIVRPQDREDYEAVRQRIMSGEDVGRVEAVFVTKGGAEISVEGSLECRFVDGKPFATRGIFRDITERQAVDRMKQEFISTVSHELRTPLTSILASLELLDSTATADDADRRSELLDLAQRNSRRLLRLINDLLDLQKLSAKRMKFRIQRLEVAPLLAEAAEEVQPVAAAAGVDLRLEPPAGVEVLADRDRLLQVLNNLLSNAIKFSPRGEAVSLGARSEGDRVIFSVADHGPGIPEELRRRLYQKFTQLRPAVSGAGGGSGLGLSIVKALVEGMSGRVALDTAVATGTKFDVYLPRATAPR